MANEAHGMANNVDPDQGYTVCPDLFVPKHRSCNTTKPTKSASLGKPNSYPHDGIFNLHLTTIKDPYILAYLTGISMKPTGARKCCLT